MSDPLFTRDTKGDKQNVIYGRPNQYTTPKYRPAGKGFLIGLSRHHRLSTLTGCEGQILTTGVDTGQRSRYQSLLSAANGKEEHLFTACRDATDSIRDQLNYVSLGSGRAKKRRRLLQDTEGTPDGILESRADDATSSSEEDESMISTQNLSDAYASFQNDPIQRIQRSLRDQTVKDSDDIDAWLALVNLQADLITEQNGMQPRNTSQERLVSKLRLSIFEEALSKVQSPAGRVRLTEGYMTEGGKIWEIDKQSSEWQRLLLHDASFQLRKLYINHVQSNIQHFTVENVIDAYTEAFKRTGKGISRQEQDKSCTYLVLRFTVFLRQTGFSERAVAIWQSMLEYSFFQPPSLTPTDELSALEEFWESEVARIGESVAKGWSGPQHEKEAGQDPPSVASEKPTGPSSWCAAEQSYSKQARLPARSFDLTNDSDPYRVVLFQDIKPFVFKLTSNLARATLLSAFLCFIGLPNLASEPNPGQWLSDPFLAIPGGLSSVQAPFAGVTDSLSLFQASKTIFNALPSISEFSIDASWISRTLQLIVLAQPQTSRLGELCIAFEARRDLPSARKLAKKLLKQSPDSLRLYNAYALLEAGFGTLETAENVWSTSLALQKPSTPSLLPQTVGLWHSWVWTSILRQDPQRAYEVLRMMAAGTTSTSVSAPNADGCDMSHSKARYLALRQSIEMTLDTARESSDIEAMTLTFDLLAILDYLEHNQDLLRAMQTYETSLPLLSIVCQGSRSNVSPRAVELLHQHRARLIHAHVLRSAKAFKPQLVMKTLQASAKAFPENSIFLTMLQQYRQRYGLVDRLREHSISATSTASAMQCIVSIQNEMERPEYAGKTEHSIRAVFLRAEEENSPARFCPAVRLLHLRWEISLLEKDTPSVPASPRKKDRKSDKASASAVNVLHSALSACPWVKELYLTALSSPELCNALTPSGVLSLYRAMLDRGIRVHADTLDLLGQ